LAVIVPGPVGPATREVEAEVAAILDLREHDPVAFGRLSQYERRAVVAVSDVRADDRAKVVAGNRTRPVDREATFERELIAAEPAAEDDPQIQLVVRPEPVVAAEVEEATRVLDVIAGLRLARERRWRDLGRAAGAMLDVRHRQPA